MHTITQNYNYSKTKQNMKKTLSLAAMLICGAASLSAQQLMENATWTFEGGVGSELEVGVRAQHKFNEYVAWDILHAKYAYDYNKGGDFNELTLTTGVRGYSPSFGPDLKGFAALDLGYGLAWPDAHSNLAVDLTFGLYVWKNLYVGYGLGLLHHNGNHKDHVLRVGFDF